MSAAKLGVAGLWLLCLGSFLLAADSTAGHLGRIVFWALVLAHAVECAIFLPLLRRAPGPLAPHLLQTLAFGFVHVQEVRQAGKET